MKRRIAVLLILCLIPGLVACTGASEKTGKEDLTPLFRVSAAEDAVRTARLFSLPKSQGYLYLYPKEEGGFVCGFVSTARSLSCEAILESDADPASVTVWENGRDQVHVLTEEELFLVLPAENAATRTALPEGVSGAGALSASPLSYIVPSEELLLVHPVDFSKTYVLARIALLPDFACLMTSSNDGKRIWYAKGQEGAYTGFGFFEYGSNLPLGGTAFSFDSWMRVGEGRVLLIKEEDGVFRYTMRNLETEEERSFSSKEEFTAVACSAGGRVLCLGRNVGEGSEVQIVDLLSGKILGKSAISYGHLAPSMALSTDGSELFLAIGKGQDLMFATLATGMGEA